MHVSVCLIVLLRGNWISLLG
uniref:Uncharacterized protein n=1 Tax=Anguilla anguilla TaxID=7936 RepID=A0A0E9S6W2_ANGAN